MNNTNFTQRINNGKTSCPPRPEGEGLGVRAEISQLAGVHRQIPMFC
jgi:hypothetical protein